MTKRQPQFLFDPQKQSITAHHASKNKISGLKADRRNILESVLKAAIPLLGTDIRKVALAQVLISLKLEGVLEEELSPEQYKMVKVITDAFLSDTNQCDEAEKLIKKLS